MVVTVWEIAMRSQIDEIHVNAAKSSPEKANTTV
jgi:hypothetical protein